MATDKATPKLLTRDEFRAAVFARDHHRCVVCQAPAKDAHHILERRLFPDGGYYLDNGASLCESCHVKAEMTVLSADTLRHIIGITKVVLPPHLYKGEQYDKWGNPFLPNGLRLRGELFFDENVQKILAQGGVLSEFSKYVKYPRTYHLPWSENIKYGDKIKGDEKVLEDTKCFEGKEVVVTLKMDGENTSMYRDYIHARSLSSSSHESRDWVKNLHARLWPDIPVDWRLCGENLYAKHSILYKHLPAWFLLFSVWNERNICLSWDETCEWAGLLGLETVPVLYRGKWDEKLIKGLFKPTHNGDQTEGYVVRVVDSFSYSDFKKSVAKFVRKDHVQSHAHWLHNKLEINGLAKWEK